MDTAYKSIKNTLNKFYINIMNIIKIENKFKGPISMPSLNKGNYVKYIYIIFILYYYYFIY